MFNIIHLYVLEHTSIGSYSFIGQSSQLMSIMSLSVIQLSEALKWLRDEVKFSFSTSRTKLRLHRHHHKHTEH